MRDDDAPTMPAEQDSSKGPGKRPALPVGRAFDSRVRILTEDECATLTSLLWVSGRVHTDRAYASTTEFGQLILSGATVVAVANGLLSSTELYRDLEPVYGLRILAGLDQSARFLAPVRFDDSIHVRLVLTAHRPSSSRPRTHVLSFEDRVIRQDGVEALKITRHTLAEEL